MPQIEPSETIAGVVVVTPDVHGDNRGRFVETFRQEWVPGAPGMVQANRADRKQGALVGLHYHLHQADFWYVPFGRAMVVLHDLRRVYIPPGVAHGFYAQSDMTITYLVDHYYNPDDELGVAWDDPELGVAWPTTEPELSARDRSNPKRSEIPPELRPR